jgi:hypothetical protein
MQVLVPFHTTLQTEMKTVTARGVGRYLYALTEAVQGRGPESSQAAAAGHVLCAEALSVSGWFFKKKSIMMQGNMNVKFNYLTFNLNDVFLELVAG